jgi:N-carbamoylputrescine amidase
MTKLTVAALQLPLGSLDEAENIAAVSALVEEAAGKGAQIILPPELFSGPYFCKVEDDALFSLARPVAEHPSVVAMRKLAKSLGVAIPTSFFEKDGHHYYNTLAMIDADGEIMGTSLMVRATRKSSISARATTGSRCGTCSARVSASACAGTSGIRKPPASSP